MKLESDGILIELRPLAERDAIARIFTRDHGVVGGVMRAAQIAKKNKPLVGQMGGVIWNARLDSQLGVFHWEATRNMAAPLMCDAMRLGLMNAAFSLIGTFLPERESYPNIYAQTVVLLNSLGGENAAAAYLGWEVEFLSGIGYALQLDRCAGCGGVDDLRYLSPRTARAVCVNCGAPYADKLYPLPLTFGTTRRLLEHATMLMGATIPPARLMLRDDVKI
ncbi:DNA repair protein RecO [bacterium]|nr:DNA repair protein RecO [bacterium]